MPRKHEIEIYEFDELPEASKKRAIEDYREHAWDQNDSEWLTETFKEILEEKGLPSKDVEWRLSWSQGDGVAFYGPVDLKKYLKPRTQTGRKEWSPKGVKFHSLVDKVAVEVTRTSLASHYSHAHTMNVERDILEDLTSEEEQILNELLEKIGEDIVEMSRKLEKIGYDEIEYRTSDEAISDFFRNNEFEFTKDGKVWRG